MHTNIEAVWEHRETDSITVLHGSGWAPKGSFGAICFFEISLHNHFALTKAYNFHLISCRSVFKDV